jgi:tetratricopeptide (TPR) repeat protein
VKDEDLKSLREHPRFAAIHKRGLQHQKHVQAIKTAFKERDWANAITACKAMIVLDEDFAPGFRLLGRACLEHGDQELALKVLQVHIDRGEDIGAALFDVGRVHNKRGDTKAALTSMEQAVVWGYHDAKDILSHKDIANLKADPRFQKLLKQARYYEELEAKKKAKKDYSGEKRKEAAIKKSSKTSTRVKRL